MISIDHAERMTEYFSSIPWHLNKLHKLCVADSDPKSSVAVPAWVPKEEESSYIKLCHELPTLATTAGFESQAEQW